MPRSILAPHRLAAVIAALCALALFGCGSDDDTSTTTPRTTADRPAADPASEQAGGRGSEKGEEGSDRKRRPEQGGKALAEQGNGADAVNTGQQQAQPVKAKSGNGPSGKKPANPSAHSGGGSTSVRGCPQGVSKSECRAAAETIEQGSTTTSSGSASSCPAGMSEADCEAAAGSLQKAPSSSPSGASQCPPGVSEAECREAAEALGR